MQTKEIKLRLSPEDHHQLTQAAKQLGMPLAVYIKAAALEKMHKHNIAPTQAITTPEQPNDALSYTKTSATTGYATKTSSLTLEQIEASLIPVITRTDLTDRLKTNLTPTKAHTIPAQLKKLPVTSLRNYTQERDPEGKQWEPINPERSLWKCIS